MNYRRFGRTGWNVSEIGYGMWGLAGWTGSDDGESMASLRRAIELGCNFFDTAWAYGDGKAKRYLERSSGSSRGIPRSAGPTNISTWPQKFRPRIAAGRAAATLRWMIATHRCISRNISRGV